MGSRGTGCCTGGRPFTEGIGGDVQALSRVAWYAFAKRMRRLSLAIGALALELAHPMRQPLQVRPPLSAADVADIVTLEKLEDRRDFDAQALTRIAAAK